MDIEVKVSHIPVVNFALQQNHVPVIREIAIKNNQEKDLKDVCVRIAFEPEFATSYTHHIESIDMGAEEKMTAIPIQISTSFLSQLTERLLGHIHIEITTENQPLFSQSYEISLLTFDQWCGIDILPEMLAAFITPNHPAITPLIKRASEILGSWDSSPDLDEYQTRDPNRVKKQMAAVYEAIAEQQITYCTVPASFEESGQRVRLYDNILSNKLGNCLDMSLLYAGCLEAIGLHPLIVIVKGHAFAGCWLIPDSFPDSVSDDFSLLAKRTAEGINEILLIESTYMNTGTTQSFDAASAAANYRMKETDDFLLFIDVVRARNAQIRPLPIRVVHDGQLELIEESPTERDSSAPSLLSATDIITDIDRINVDKQTIWERKLLDLSLRNNLLNTRITRNTLQLISVKISELEDALADGQEFQILERPQDWDNPLMCSGIYQALHTSDPIIDLVKSELKQKRVRSYLSEENLSRSLTYLYRSSRLSMEENGANTLYLALGLLKWLETPSSTRPRFAPILLLPIEIIRKSAAKGYVIRSRDEETMLNITLLEMLRQYFGIHIGGLDPLPHDESGVDVSLIFNTIRRAIMFQKGWDIEEQAIIGNFSFNKFIMWNDIHNNADKLKRNRIVASLMSGKIEWTPEDDNLDTADLDETYPAGEIALPLGADSSQFEAICTAIDDKSFILHGPPGTGKSQTITNIIANALYKGKKVLFVAEKMAALQVVQRRLEAIGIAPFCLELHSNKTKKANVLAQLKRTIDVVKRKSNEEFRIEAKQINELRRELNSYVHILHKPYRIGLSLYDCFSGYASIDYQGELMTFSEKFLQNLDSANQSCYTEAIEEYQAILHICKQPQYHPLKEIGLTTYTPGIKTTAQNELAQLTTQLQEELNLHIKLSRLFAFDLTNLSSQQEKALIACIQTLLKAEVLPTALLAIDNPTEIYRLIDQTIRAGKGRDFLKAQILQHFDTRIFHADIIAWEQQWINSRSKWLLPRILGQIKLKRQIRPYTQNTTNLTTAYLTELFTNFNTYQKLQQQLKHAGQVLAPVLGPLWNNGEGEWDRIELARNTAERIEQTLLEITCNTTQATASKRELQSHLECGLQAFKQLYGATLERLLMVDNEVTKHIEQIQHLLQTTALTTIETNRIKTLQAITTQWSLHLDLLHDWVTYNTQRQKLCSLDLDLVAQAVEKGQIPENRVNDYYRKSLFKAYAEYILSQEPQMNAFHGILFQEKIKRFRILSQRFEQLTREELYAKLASTLPALQKEAAQSSEVGILQRNIRNGGRGTSIRRLFEQIPDLLTRMCPCFLMSPISVAQYINAGQAPFDLVIFDEASQMPTCEAVGAIARGRNVIVVGDPKQMPPTDFFSTNTYDEDNADKEDLESILDDCLALSMPSKHLLWHYRSKHESLIAFSNTNYYDNRLLTFPSPDDLTTKVHFQHIDGVYDRGSSRQNRAEAEAIVQEIKLRLTNPQTAQQSIGVVTFNSNQQSLIEDLLNELFKESPDLETLALEREEPIFVKNLENVQGDERDIILFSVGYGPDKTGRVALNFGPLNRHGGWRRLNVAVSRARHEMKVFSTLQPDQIDLNRSSAEGVAGLKAFLEYAQKGRETLPHTTINERKTNDFLLQTIALDLEKRGYQVRTNIGCSGYRIDIGIIDPEYPDRYLLGVLCDGYNHQATRTAHDRIVTQLGVLQTLGWRLHHIWAMDWWENRSRTIDTLIQAIEKAKTEQNNIEKTQQDSISTSPQPEPTTTSQPTYQESGELIFEPDTQIEPYQVAQLPDTPVSSNDFTLGYYDSQALDKLRTVVNIEAPISKALLCKRVLNSFAINRMGSKIATHMNLLLTKAQFKTSEYETPFYWNDNQDPKTYSIYRPNSDREALDIAPEEISVALCQILEEQGALPETDLLREVAHRFNFTRLGDNVMTSMMRGLSYALQSRLALRKEGKIIKNLEVPK